MVLLSYKVRGRRYKLYYFNHFVLQGAVDLRNSVSKNLVNLIICQELIPGTITTMLITCTGLSPGKKSRVVLLGVHSGREARGVRGHAPLENFEIMNALRCNLVHS